MSHGGYWEGKDQRVVLRCVASNGYRDSEEPEWIPVIRDENMSNEQRATNEERAFRRCEYIRYK
jgi:hypothetical protein